MMADTSVEEEFVFGCGEETTTNNRRRSSFFVKRTSIMPEPRPNSEKCPDEISKYMDELKREEASWKAELRNQKLVYQDSKKRYEAKQDSQVKRLDYSVLTAEDMDLMKSKPSLAIFTENVAALERTVSDTCHLYLQLAEQRQRMADECEGQLDSIQDYILENSNTPKLV